MLLNILLEAENFANNAQEIAQTTFENFNQSAEEMDQSADQWVHQLGLEISTAGMAIADALNGLPQTAQDLAQEMPKLGTSIATSGRAESGGYASLRFRCDATV